MIEVKALRYTYPGSQEAAIRGLDFVIEDGEIFGFLGPSGAGKSTTQKILTGVLRGYEGSVRVNGTDMRSRGGGYYNGIGVSFETPNLFRKLTGVENLKFFASLYGGATESPELLLDLVGLGEKGDVPVGEYSKGMRMRLNFVRSLLNRPRVLFLDEPTAGLDPTNARRIREIIQTQRAEGTTVFVTTHNMNVADELCDRVAFIVEGAIPVIESPRELKIQHGRKVVRVEYATPRGTDVREFPFESIGTNEAFSRLLRNQRVETIHSLEATLEEIFIDVTGRDLSAPSEDDAQ